MNLKEKNLLKSVILNVEEKMNPVFLEGRAKTIYLNLKLNLRRTEKY